jgi:hypothetical protein
VFLVAFVLFVPAPKALLNGTREDKVNTAPAAPAYFIKVRREIFPSESELFSGHIDTLKSNSGCY